MNRHLRNRLQYHRHLGNALSALSATAILLVAALMVAGPAKPSATPSVAQAAEPTFIAAPSVPPQPLGASAMQAQVEDIAARAEHLAAQLETTRDATQAIAHVAAFTAEVATVAALTAALDELPDSVETARIATPTPAPPTRKHKRNRQSMAMPYFSFASRS